MRTGEGGEKREGRACYLRDGHGYPPTEHLTTLSLPLVHRRGMSRVHLSLPDKSIC